MKKYTWVILAAAVLAMTACGKGQTENVPTQAAAPMQQTTAAAAKSDGAGTDAVKIETTAEAPVELSTAPLPEEYDAEYFEGVATDISGSFLTIVSEDGTKKAFDISNAERQENDGFMQGCYVEVSYAEVEGVDAMPADALNVLMDIEQQAEMEGRDPVIYGKVQLLDINDLELVDYNGVTRELDNSMGRKVSSGEIRPGDTVAVTYCGSLFTEADSMDEDGEINHPIVVKIVAMDALESEDAKADYISGIVDRIGKGYIALLTDAVTFDVQGDEKIFEGIEEENHVRVYYQGSLNGISVDAVKIEKE